ncbi:uncharacterized protein BDR25DRAFT_393820 [Lindgomyces ingoldianus]|uniref:Uncharacterized protein n=1 Tax=Lindgomyces ingoldianus TaxID=673940 RepID=A0ACB6QTS0_9PLEO|nr:uncharacterized protein BDR25DRAFT_393820 [Lindgomyces ingoldianus]KAF2470252.1 hypothetical protein BDR25DRAFT_393820 [Lindgomyces ingoldianus]
MLTHFKRLCSAIDDLPLELDFGVAQLPQDSRVSQDLESHYLLRSFVESASQAEDDDSHSNIRDATPNTSRKAAKQMPCTEIVLPGRVSHPSKLRPSYQIKASSPKLSHRFLANSRNYRQ